MIYLFHRAPSMLITKPKPHTAPYYKIHICIWQSNLSKHACHMMFWSWSFFFFSLKFVAFSQSDFCFSKICVCYSGGNFSSVFFHSGSTSSSLPPKWTWGNHAAMGNSPLLTQRRALILSNGQPENKMLCMPTPTKKGALFPDLHRKIH